MNIEVGQIFQVVTEKFIGVRYHAKIENINPNGERECDVAVHLKLGEYIEIRYPYQWHFRTVDNLYLHATSLDILEHCKYIGKIHEKVRFENKTELSQILEDNLYTHLFSGELNEQDN